MSGSDPCAPAMGPSLWSFAIQAAGSAATVGAALLVTSGLGLSAQGEFGLLRSWSDALTTAAVLGLPQSLLHLQYREGVPVTTLRAWVLRYVLVLATVLVVIAAAAVLWWPQRRALGLDDATVLVLAAAVPLAATHLLYRSLLLRGVGAIRYAVITALPSLLVFAGLVPICLAAARVDFVWALFGAALVSAIVSGWLVWRVPRADVGGAVVARWSRRTLWSVGIETGGQSVLTALSPALMLSTASLLGASLLQIGAVSLGLHVYQLFGVAAAYVAPLVYDRAARADAPLAARELFGLLRRRVDARALAAIALATVFATGLVARYWPAAAPSAWLLLAMALAGAISMAVRLLTTLMLARGAFRPLSFQAVGRLVCACGGTALLMQVGSAGTAVPAALLATELLMLAWLAHSMRRLGAAAPIGHMS